MTVHMQYAHTVTLRYSMWYMLYQTLLTHTLPPPLLREYTPVLMALKHLANGALPESLGVQLRNLPYILGVRGIAHSQWLHLHISHLFGE